jgi:bifunctional DNA-binding transcriptional regulator/antitoxin component of YhaV-PrlF toxin-antitoxin module
MVTTLLERDQMDSKIIRVSKKRQITIPLEFFQRLGISSEVECFLENGAIVIRPLLRHGGDEFSVDILKDLVAKGLSGAELIRQFEIERANIKGAVRKMLEDVDKIADGSVPSATFGDVFNSES